MKTPFNDIKLRFGIYKGKIIQDVPDSYLKFLLSKNILKGKLLLHCQYRFNMPKNKYKVEVMNSVRKDGIYYVEAYNRNDAAIKCQVEYKIQNTQSHCGTEYKITLI
jgi:hypothetical protein